MEPTLQLAAMSWETHRLMETVVTAALAPLAVAMAWRCWSLPPMPLREIRVWAVAFAAMTLAMLGQMWRAELAETELRQLRQSPQEPQQLSSAACVFQRLGSTLGRAGRDRPAIGGPRLPRRSWGFSPRSGRSVPPGSGPDGFAATSRFPSGQPWALIGTQQTAKAQII